MTLVEELGLLKKWISLGCVLLQLSMMRQSILREQKGIKINIDEIDYNAPKTLDHISTGNTNGIFQLESAGMQSFYETAPSQEP